MKRLIILIITIIAIFAISKAYSQDKSIHANPNDFVPQFPIKNSCGNGGNTIACIVEIHEYTNELFEWIEYYKEDIGMYPDNVTPLQESIDEFTSKLNYYYLNKDSISRNVDIEYWIDGVKTPFK